jgi:hypothetical protein
MRRIERYLSYAQWLQLDTSGHPLQPDEAKQQRRFKIESEEYQIDKAETHERAQQ